VSEPQVKLTVTLKQKIWLPAFKKFHAHPLKPAEAECSFRKVSLPLAKLRTCMLFFVHL